ncbi:hypothetical protein SAMN05216215_1001334 [Saccharopolyspora shandongensis]|uniref:Uncharacterized protein n=1 Tax=Saccharopolyspora shandongensis TaxID=418495 RepID=A0A1H2RA58_9PSEU|nr:hypothetical protein [Saccharopolyspora shandongensis]SDW16287.1 hypothetical protein SAMN05216215_1001334 [Saccharopolyspora shandongensis]
MRYALRVLALVVVVAAGVGLGIWWNRPPEVRSPQEVAALLPAAGDGFRANDESSYDRVSFLATVEDCAPVPVVQQFRTASSAVFKGYTIGEETSALVAIVQLAQDDVAPVRDALRSAGNCQRPDTSGGSVWTKIARPWFGDVSALFTTTDTTMDAEGRFVTNIGGGPVWTFTMSDEWLVAIGAYTSPLQTAADIYPPMLAAFDREVGTNFLQPGESRGGCPPADVAIADLPPGALSRQAITQLQSMHDLACQNRMDAVLAVLSAPLVVDDGVDVDGRVDVDDPAGFARILESRAVYRNGAVTYRSGDSALVFSTLYTPGAPPLGWDAYVRHCSTAEPAAARLCEPDPYGPLGGADWTAVLAERGCGEEYPAIVHSRFQDLTGDGRPEPVLAVNCDLADGTRLREVQVYDGGSPPDSPRLIQALLGDDPGPQGTGLAPATVTLSGDELTVQSWSWPPDDPQGNPNLLVTDGFRWQDGNFVPEWRDVEDMS